MIRPPQGASTLHHDNFGTMAARKPYYMSSANIARSRAMGDLSDSQVMDIRLCRAQGQKVKDIAADYAISAQCVSQICNGRTYKHLPLVEAA